MEGILVLVLILIIFGIIGFIFWVKSMNDQSKELADEIRKTENNIRMLKKRLEDEQTRT